MKTPTFVVIVVVALLGCGVEQPMSEPAVVEPPVAEQPSQQQELTGFPCEVREVLQAACAGCHVPAVYFGSFRSRAEFVSPERTPMLKDLVSERLQVGARSPMPPYGAARQLTPAEKELVSAWLAQGAPAGSCGELAP